MTLMTLLAQLMTLELSITPQTLPVCSAPALVRDQIIHRQLERARTQDRHYRAAQN